MPDLVLKGKAIKLGDNISTDDIIPGRFAHLRSNLPELARHVLEDAVPGFASRVRDLSLQAEGKTILVTGKNLGLGSSREHAPVVIKMSGVGAIMAKSAARIFFRNAINQGLPVLLCDTDKIGDGDELEIDVTGGTITNLTSGTSLSCSKMPPIMSAILEEGGLIPYVRKHKGFVITG
ncbi:MAG: 3-isopropylmalate dehydratase small subunit [Dehalococcoidia bacterium]|jgi:3-isopropylmalate/(R)-2-methylmalate dehydratase small subunit